MEQLVIYRVWFGSYYKVLEQRHTTITRARLWTTFSPATLTHTLSLSSAQKNQKNNSSPHSHSDSGALGFLSISCFYELLKGVH